MVGGEDLDDKSVPLVFGLGMSLCGRCAGTMMSFLQQQGQGCFHANCPTTNQIEILHEMATTPGSETV